MNIFKTEEITVPCKKYENGDWKEVKMTAKDALVITDITDEEHDQLLNLRDNLDPDGLKGMIITMHVKDGDGDDPAQINLAGMPMRGDLIRHYDRYYEIKQVIQSTSGGIAVYTQRATPPQA